MLYRLYDADEELAAHDIGEEEESVPPYKEVLLPSRSLDQLWEKYVVPTHRHCAESFTSNWRGLNIKPHIRKWRERRDARLR